jgi:hypothetical protein
MALSKMTRHLLFIGLFLTSCSFHQMTEKRARRNSDIVDKMAVDILALNENKFLVDTLGPKELRKNLRKVNAELVEVFKTKHYEFQQDSLIVLSRHNFMLIFDEIIIDFKKTERELTTIGGLKKIRNRIYFRKKTMSIS